MPPLRLCAAALACLAGACTDVSGGAVELSWRLRPSSSATSDKFVSCNPDPAQFPGVGVVTRIRLDWEVIGEKTGLASWPCDESHGVTGFDLPSGDALLMITPECNGQPAAEGTYIAPSPVQRQVSDGDVVSLGALELALVVSDCGIGPGLPPCICAP